MLERLRKAGPGHLLACGDMGHKTYWLLVTLLCMYCNHSCQPGGLEIIHLSHPRYACSLESNFRYDASEVGLTSVATSCHCSTRLLMTGAALLESCALSFRNGLL